MKLVATILASTGRKHFYHLRKFFVQHGIEHTMQMKISSG